MGDIFDIDFNNCDYNKNIKSNEVYNVVVIPDLHLYDKNIGSCLNYVNDSIIYLNKIKEEILKLDGKIVVIFSGDVFHNSFTNIDMYFYWVDFIRDFRKSCFEVYSLIGNHETTYYKSNPFWRLVKTIDSDYVNSIKDKVCLPKGQENTLIVTDSVVLGDVCISFGHHGFYPKPNKDYINNILVSHNSVISSEIVSVLKNKYGRDPLTGFIDYSYIATTNPFEGFNYVYNGHMHKAYSKFTIEDEDTGFKTELQYIGSIGRTNKLEYNDSDLIRNIPVLTICNGEVITKAITIKLKNITESLNLIEIENKDRKRDLDKEYKSICKKVSIDFNPIEDLKNLLPSFAVLIDNCVSGVKPAIVSTMEKAVYRDKDI